MQTIKKSLVYCLLLLCVVACAPKPDALDSDGNKIYFKDYANKWLVLNYWATWCKPCFVEVPALNQFYLNHQDKVAVLGIHFDAIELEKMNSFKKEYNVRYPLLVTNPGSLFGIEEIPNLPATFLISPDRKQVFTLFGEQTEESLLAVLEKEQG